MKFNDLLPKAEQAEQEENRCKALLDRLLKLMATLSQMEANQEAQMAVWLPRSVPALEKAEHAQAVSYK